jgi:hypothetical protein
MYLKTTNMIINDSFFKNQSIFDGVVGIRLLCNLKSMLLPSQCRAARALLDWSQQTLADAAGVGVVTIRQLEAATHSPRRATLEVVKRCLETAGIEFIEKNGGGAGVRLRK